MNAPPGGVYRCNAEQQLEIEARRGFAADHAIFTLDLTGITDKASFLGQIAAVMAFPSYFGHNWDALYDCLTDPPNSPVAGTLLVVDRGEAFAAREPDEWATAIRVFQAAAEYRRCSATPLLVLFAGETPSPTTPPLPGLPD